MRYDLTGLGADGFEKLCLALAKSLHGPPVRLADDDRQDDSDAASEETPDSSEPVYAENRVGLLTLIAKYVSVSGYPEEDFRKLERAVKLELDALYELQLSGTNSDQLPHWILFATNITLTKNIGDGRETIDALINDYSGRLPLHGWIIWDAYEISRHLDNHPDIRLTFVLEQDYISNLRPTSEFDSLTVFRLSSLGERPSECAEIVPSWWRLLATHDAVTGLFETLYSVRQKAVGHIDESEIGRSYERLQDLLRAAIVFTSAGIDSCLQSLLTRFRE